MPGHRPRFGRLDTERLGVEQLSSRPPIQVSTAYLGLNGARVKTNFVSKGDDFLATKCNTDSDEIVFSVCVLDAISSDQRDSQSGEAE